MTDRIRIGSTTDFRADALTKVDAGGTAVVVGRDAEGVCAARNHCPHMGLSLASGHLEDGVVTCPWHGSRFELRSGRNLDWATGFAGRTMPRWSQRLIAMGRKPAPLTTYPVTVEGDDVYVEVE